jgi:hypothetical protein
MIPHATIAQLTAGLLFDPEDGGEVLPKRGAIFELHVYGVTAHKTVIFTVSAVTTLNPKLLGRFSLTIKGAGHVARTGQKYTQSFGKIPEGGRPLVSPKQG